MWNAGNDDKLGRILLQGQDSGNGALEDFAETTFSSSVVNIGSEDGKIEFKQKLWRGISQKNF